MSEATGRRVLRLLPLLAIVALGVQLRLTFYQGVLHTDDLVYSHLAQRLAEGISPFTAPLPPSYAAVRIGLYGPVALAYWLFGASEATTLAWPFLCSLVAIVGAYAIGRLLHNEASGLLAAFFLAVLPTSVAAATALLGDGPIAALSIATVFLLVLSGRTQGWRSVASMAGSLGCFALGILNKPLILLTLPFLLIYFVRQMKRTLLMVGGLAAAIGGAIAGYLLYFGVGAPASRPGVAETMERLAGTATDLWQQLVIGQREFAWIAPLWIVAVVAMLAWRRTESRVVLLWVCVTFLFGELGTRTLTSYTPIVWYDAATSARHFLLIAAPAMILTGIYLSEGLTNTAARWLTGCAAVITGVAAWIGTTGASNMTWGVTKEAVLPFATLSGVATIVVVFGGFVSPLFLRSRSEVLRIAGTGALMVAVGLGALGQTYRAANEFKGPWVETFPEAVKFLESQPALPIIAQNEMVGLRLDYLSGFRFGFDTSLRPFVQNPRIRVAPLDETTLTDAYVLIDEYFLRVARDIAALRPGTEPAVPTYLLTPPARWLPIAEFGKYPTNHLKIYRVSSGSGHEELTAARAAAATSRTPISLRALLDAAIAAGESCEAVQTWFDLRAMASDAVRTYDPVPILTECYRANPEIAGPNLFLNGDFSRGFWAWSTHPESDALVQIEEEPEGSLVWHANLRRGNWAVLVQEQLLQSNTAYIYEATIRTSVSVVALYWQSDIGRSFAADSAYSTWTTLRYVFVTPDLPDPIRAAFYPVLMPVAGHVWIKGLRLSELKKPGS
jgi:hypothetical protein